MVRVTDLGRLRPAGSDGYHRRPRSAEPLRRAGRMTRKGYHRRDDDPLTADLHEKHVPVPVAEPFHPGGGPRSGGSMMRIATAVAWVWFVGLMSLGTWASYWAPLRDDHYQLICLGQRVYEGGRLYLDCWENKPPGIAWINAIAIALAGGRQLGAWIMPAVVSVAVMALISLAVRRVLGRAAGVAILLLAGVLMSMRVHDAPSINPDFYCAALALGAVCAFVLALVGRTGAPRGGWALLAGLLWAGAT